MSTKPLPDVQQGCLEALVRHHQWPGCWVWQNRSTTVRALDALVKKGLATKDDRGTYRPTDAGRDALRPAHLKELSK